MVDFSKLKDPAYKAKLKAQREAHEHMLDQQHKANLFMVDKLYKMAEQGQIEDDYDLSFISSVKNRMAASLPLTKKQEMFLSKLFHDKY